MYYLLSPVIVAGLEAILDEWETNHAKKDDRWPAYMLATTHHETDRKMWPIEEYGRGRGRKYGRPDPQTGKVYYGRGFVQLTWKYNYEKMGRKLGVDLVNRPERTQNHQRARQGEADRELRHPLLCDAELHDGVPVIISRTFGQSFGPKTLLHSFGDSFTLGCRARPRVTCKPLAVVKVALRGVEMSNGPDATDSIRETACHQVGSEQSCKLPLHNVLLSLRTLTVLLVAIPLAIIAIAVLRNVYLDIFGAKTMFGRLTPLGLEEEDSITDWYTSLLHAFIAALLVLSGRIEPIARWKPYWFGLAGIFIYLSMDEAAALHEMWMGPLERFEFTGVLTYSWIIPFALLCLLLGLIYLPFLRSREPQLRRITILAGLIFVGSALGLEMVEGYCATHFGWRGQCFQWSMNIEETGEMASLTIFALALLRDFRRRYSGVTVEIA